MQISYEMSDAEWQTLGQIISLPENARRSIDDAIWQYKVASRIEYDPSHSRSQLNRSSRAIDDVRRSMKALLSDGLALFQIAHSISRSNVPTPRMAGKQYLETVLVQLESTDAVLKNAAAQIKPAKRGTRTRSILIHFLIKQLDQTLHTYRGQPLARSGKINDKSIEYVVAVCRLADRSIGKGSIDEAMKQVIRSRGGISSAPVP